MGVSGLTPLLLLLLLVLLELLFFEEEEELEGEFELSCLPVTEKERSKGLGSSSNLLFLTTTTVLLLLPLFVVVVVVVAATVVVVVDEAETESADFIDDIKLSCWVYALVEGERGSGKKGERGDIVLT